jgi:hypothetical protein
MNTSALQTHLQDQYQVKDDEVEDIYRVCGTR